MYLRNVFHIDSSNIISDQILLDSAKQSFTDTKYSKEHTIILDILKVCNFYDYYILIYGYLSTDNYIQICLKMCMSLK